jgi:SNF2 family DNA or RNA helicase
LLSEVYEKLQNIFEKKSMDFNKISLRYKKVSYLKKPEDLTLEEWQYSLRKQFAETHYFRIKKKGTHPVFSDFDVYNPETKLTYKVALRSKDNSANFCECGDFKTNGLGTCKHIEAVFRHIDTVLNKSHLLDYGHNQAYTSIYLDYRDDRKVKIRIGSENTQEFQVLAGKYFDSNKTLLADTFDVFNEILLQGKTINDNFRCYPDALSFIIETREDRKRSKLVHEKYRLQLNNGVFDKLVNAKLYPYQKEGICFAAEKGRCIIADDMGLGKTLQAIAATELLRKESGILSAFIICPTSLKYQWKSEIEKFTGQQAWVIEGLFTKRIEQYQNDYFYKIVSYNTAINDIKEISAVLPDIVILDEAQRIKNFKTKISQHIKKLISPYSLVLTGTPLENKLEELYSIVQFTNPYTLGPFYRFIHEHRITDEKGKVTGYQDLNKIGKILSRTMIRRRKKDVLLQLPERTDEVLYVTMTEFQSKIHEEYRQYVAQLILKWQRQGFLNEKDRQNLMIFLNTMRMVCDSTYILDQTTRHETKIDELLNILDKVFTEGSEKVVIFSQWERMTRIVGQELDARNVKFQYLHGGIPGVDRGKLFDNFNNDPDCRVFLSTDAGGVGLNLQAASFLINLDIPWNPAVLEQRIGRIYRIGQKRKVSIINMVSTGTIEHKMLGVLSFKKGLSDGILDQGENTIFMGDSKFKILMNTVEEMIISDSSPSSQSLSDEFEETQSASVLNYNGNSVEEPMRQQEIPFMPSFIGDDDEVQHDEPDKKPRVETGSPADLIQTGLSFLEKLTQTLSSPEATQKLVSSIMQKDEKDGKTYLKIPVENEKVIENALALFAGIFNQKKI